MKNNPRIALLLGCLLAFTSTAKAESAAKGPIDVYLLGGQSNMSGQGRISDIPAGEEMVEGVLYYHSATVKGSSAPNTLHTNVTPAGANKNAFGPEIGFANRIKQLRPGASMAIIKYSVVGTSLITDWRPGANAADTANWGPQFAGFVKTVNGGLAALRDAGYQPRIVGMLWQQGEQDAKDGWDCRTNPPKALAGETDAGSLYEANLVHFIARVREQFAADIAPQGMRFVQGTVLPYAPPGGDVVARFPARDKVNTAKLNIDENSAAPSSVPNTSTVECSETTTPTNKQIVDGFRDTDEVHLAAPGQLMLGKLMAEHMQGSKDGKTRPLNMQ